MGATSLQHKTVRPGSLMNYSYYHSARRPMPAARPVAAARKPSINRVWRRRLILTAVVLAALIVLPIIRSSTMPVLSDSSTSNTPTITSPNSSKSLPAVAAASGSNQCSGNQLSNFVLVSISQRHLWACDKGQRVYDSAVITGIEKYDATRTPVGTYKVYAKQTNQTLTGSDQAGSWSDPVKYWMPFLNNKYGTYGFHDATWRPDSQFGSVSPNDANASHGCVELPLGTSEWLYGWAPVGTTVTIKN